MSVPSRVFDLESVLACPQCRGTVQKTNDSLVCLECGARFSILRQIPLMFSPSNPAGTKSVTHLYDRIARDYDGTLPAHVVEHYLRRRIDLMSRHAPVGTSLDVGCGTGHLASGLAERGYEVVGLDASVGMLEVFGERIPGRGVAGYADALPFRSETFDLVACVATLHHIADAPRVAAAISEMCRVARRPGTIVIWDHNPLNPYWHLLMRRVPQDSGEERLVPLEEILATLSRQRLDRIEVRRMGFMPDFVPRVAMSAWGMVERAAERMPLVRDLAAHNVVIAQKV